MSKEKITGKEAKSESKPASSKPQAPKPQQLSQTATKIVRIAESDLDGNKKLEHGLTKIKGVSWSYAHAVRNALGLPNKKIADLSDEEINKIREALGNPEKFGIPDWLCNRRTDPVTGKTMHILSSDLVLVGKIDVKRLKTMRCFRGIRHAYGYKVRGQRTRSRGANVRGRVGGTVGVIRKKLIPQKAGESK
jgi:small subunit ribosomal protein S13